MGTILKTGTYIKKIDKGGCNYCQRSPWFRPCVQNLKQKREATHIGGKNINGGRSVKKIGSLKCAMISYFHKNKHK